MEVITILFVTNDLDYAEAFCDCITAENKSILLTVLSEKAFKEYRKLEQFHLIVLDFMISEQRGDFVRLTEVKKEAEVESSYSQKDLYRYDTAENLSNRLAFLYCLKTGNTFIRPMKGSGTIIFFCSASGGTGKTSVTLGLAQDLARFHGKRVLYINYEELESTNQYFKVQEEKTLSAYLYYAEVGNEFNKWTEAFTVSNEYGIRAFSASKGRNPLKLLNVQELAKFLEWIQKEASFDYILIDGDNSLKEETLWLISICDNFCTVNGEQDVLKGKRKQNQKKIPKKYI